jgi:hypothetical protein
MAEESVERERRKLLANSLPLMLNAIWEAHAALSPVNLASTALSQYQKLEKDAKLQQEELRSLIQDLSDLNLHTEGTGRLSLTLTRDQLLELIENYLVLQYLNQGSTGAKFTISKNIHGYDGMLSLPNKEIFTSLIEEKIDNNWIFDEISKAQTLNPSEIWIFTYQEEQRSDILFGPVFVSENRILRGRFRLMPVTSLLKLITKERFSFTVEKSESEMQGARFLLTRLDH